jgi:hypothetical protein
MSGNAFIPINHDLKYTGLVIKRSQWHHTWNFLLLDKPHTVEYIGAALGRKTVILDKKNLIDEKR